MFYFVLQTALNVVPIATKLFTASEDKIIKRFPSFNIENYKWIIESFTHTKSDLDFTLLEQE